MVSRISRAVLFVVVGLLSAASGYSQSLQKTNTVETGIYDPDPTHIANRVYHALYNWKGDEEATPMHWPKQKLDVDLATLKASLDELLQVNLSKEFPDPVKRVFLQRDLWMMFDWLAQQASGSENPVLQRKLVRCIQHLALPLSQLRQLPDNYAEQVLTDAYPIEFDRSNPTAPFLPSSLWLRNSQWVMLGDRETKSILASQHLEFFRGHSAYMVFLRLPAGRQPTIDYLNTLSSAATSHRTLPALPEGAQVALVGQIMAVDDKGQPFPTTLTDMVQIRVYRQPKKSLTMANDAQSRFEFRLDRAALFAHKTVTLKPVGQKELDFEFVNYLGQKRNVSEGKTAVMASCFDCHNEAGVDSFKTFSQLRNSNAQIKRVGVSGRSDEVGRTVTWKKRQHDFQLLREYWAD